MTTIQKERAQRSEAAIRSAAGTTGSRPVAARPAIRRSVPGAPTGAAPDPDLAAGSDATDGFDLASAPSEWLGNEVVTLAEHLATDTYALLRLIGEIDARDAYALWGALSCAAWLADACEIELSTAHRQVRVARAMRTWTCLDTAMADGDVSFGKARTIVPHLSDDNVDSLVDLARTTPISRLAMTVAAWLQRHDDPDEIARRQHRERSVSWRTDPDGMITITTRLEPADAGAVCAVIDAQVMRAPTSAAQADQTRPTLAQQRADALVATVAAVPDARAHGRAASEAEAVAPAVDEATSRVDTELVIHVSADGNHLTDGTPLGDHAVTKLLPDAFISLLMHDAERQPIDASPRRRSPTRRQRRVIDARHDQCAQPGCTATTFLDYDHIQSYDPNHPNTVTANLQRLCGPHNRAKYERSKASDASRSTLPRSSDVGR